MVSDDGLDLMYDDGLPVAVVGTSAGLAPALACLEQAGARATGPFDIRDAGWADLAMAPVVWLDLDGASDEHAQAALDALEAGARTGRWSGVIAADAAQLDLVAARTEHQALHAVIGDPRIEGRLALALAMSDVAGREVARVHEGGASEIERLRRLTDEVGRIAQTLAQMSGGERDGSRSLRETPARGGARSSQSVRAMVRARRLRDQFFQPELFADPAWDMLLDLYAAHLDQHRVAVSSLCIASAVPATTALRWIKTLTDAGLFVRRADPTDGRRVFIELSQEAADGMGAYFAELERQAESLAWSGPVVA